MELTSKVRVDSLDSKKDKERENWSWEHGLGCTPRPNPTYGDCRSAPHQEPVQFPFPPPGLSEWARPRWLGF